MGCDNHFVRYRKSGHRFSGLNPLRDTYANLSEHIRAHLLGFGNAFPNPEMESAKVRSEVRVQQGSSLGGHIFAANVGVFFDLE
jgi:hypothetical protein